MATKLALIPMKTRIADIQSVYASAAERIIAALSSLDPASYTAVKSGAVLSQVSYIVRSLDAAVQMWAPSAIRAAYQESAGVARTRLEMLGATALPANRYNPARHEKKIAGLTKTVMGDFWKANRTIEKTARKYLASLALSVRDVQKIEAFAGADDFKWIKTIIKRAREGAWKGGGLDTAGKAIAEGAGASLSSGQVSRQIRDYLSKKIGGGDFININGRNYNLKDYAELVARTRMREAQSEATKELCKEFDNDLVQFSKHDSPCEVCAPLEGQVFSVSGKDPDYPELTDDETPPIHPRCEHNLNPTSANALSWRNA